MNQTVINYHKQRRPFIIIPETGLILGETGQPFSHREILSRCGLDDEQVKYVLENYPAVIFLTTNWSSISGRMLKKVPAGN